jgi:hypothetical protein
MNRRNHVKCIIYYNFLFTECLVQVQKHFRAFFATKEIKTRMTINKPVSKYLRKHFLITTKHGDSLCNKCRHKYYVQEQRQFYIQIRDLHTVYMFILKNEWLLFNTNSAIFSAIWWREQGNFQWDDDEVHLVLDQHA